MHPGVILEHNRDGFRPGPGGAGAHIASDVHPDHRPTRLHRLIGPGSVPGLRIGPDGDPGAQLARHRPAPGRHLGGTPPGARPSPRRQTAWRPAGASAAGAKPTSTPTCDRRTNEREPEFIGLPSSIVDLRGQRLSTSLAADARSVRAALRSEAVAAIDRLGAAGLERHQGLLAAR